MWQNQLIFKIFSLSIFLFLVAASVEADEKEKRLALNFDKNSICCIMNSDELASKLQKTEGINSARYNKEDRVIILYFNPDKTDKKKIVNKISEITMVPKEFILFPKPKS